MWFNCDSACPDTKIAFSIDDEFLCVKSVSNNSKIDQNTRLCACFDSCETDNEFLIGNYVLSDDKYIIDKKYSMSYLKSVLTDFKEISHFIIDSAGEKKIYAYPVRSNDINSDPAIIRAREILTPSDQDNNPDCILKLIDNIKKKVKNYESAHLPFMREYEWYKVDNKDECFELSSVGHLISSDDFFAGERVWYFGVSPKDRVCALAVKSFSDKINPLSNADDCTIVFGGATGNEYYFVVGILLLDDGQYFCRLS